jgi:hypothetical protein
MSCNLEGLLLERGDSVIGVNNLNKQLMKEQIHWLATTPSALLKKA